MNDKPKGRMIPKQRLDIVNVEMDVPYSQGTKQLDRVFAVNLSLAEGDPLFGKTLRLTVFNDELKTFVRGQKGTIIADIEERDRPGSEYGPDRTIVQVYDDKGEPVSRKTKGGGGGQYRRSLEEDLALEAVKRRSIEGQTAISQIGNLIEKDLSLPAVNSVGLNAESRERILAKYWQAVERSLDNFLEKPAAPAPAPHQKPPDKRGTAEKPLAVAKDAPPDTDPIKHVGDLLTRAGRLKPPVTRGEIIEALSINDPAEIKDFETAWKTVLEVSASKAKNTGGETTEQAWDNIKRE